MSRGCDAAPVESWSTQPPRHGDGRLLRGPLAVVGCVAVVVAVAVVLIVRFGPGLPPDIRPLLVPVPADAVACRRDGTLLGRDRVEQGDGVPTPLALMVNRSGLLSVASRCWLRTGGSEVAVVLMRFDTAEHAAHVLSVDQGAALADVAEVPGVPGARSFRPVGGPGRLWLAVGARGTAAFAILETLTSEMRADAIEEIALAQYVRL